MTTDEDGEMEKSEESELSEAPVTPKQNPLRGQGKMPKIPRTGQTWVLKKAEVIVFPEPREVPCDRCWSKGQEFLPQFKQGKALDGCVGCFGRSYCAGQLGWVEERKRSQGRKAGEESEHSRKSS